MPLGVLHQQANLADEDSLLPVINRRAFVRELSRAMSFAQRYTQPSSLAFFDVNNMKTINDELGHAAGDAALMHVAEMLLEHVRHSDVVGRLGGDQWIWEVGRAGDYYGNVGVLLLGPFKCLV